MRLPPSQVLTLRTPMLTLLIGPMHALGAVRPVLVLTDRTSTAADRSARLALDFIRRDATQTGLLRAYLVAAAIPAASVRARTPQLVTPCSMPCATAPSAPWRSDRRRPYKSGWLPSWHWFSADCRTPFRMQAVLRRSGPRRLLRLI